MRIAHPMHDQSVEFGPVFCAPGSLGFDGEGYPFHRYWKLLGMNWDDVTFAAKTVTFPRNEGNMPLHKDSVIPQALFPRCIVVKPWSGHILNAVRLSNPGLAWFIAHRTWQRQLSPFCLSFMSLASSRTERLGELRAFVALLQPYLPTLSAPVALQLNFACPSSGHNLTELHREIGAMLDVASALSVPLIPNFNPLVPLEVIQETVKHPGCSALWIANTIPWGTNGIDWNKIFGTGDNSPLKIRGFMQEGGLSGPACLPFTLQKLYEIRQAGITIPIVAGNGIQSPDDVPVVKHAGADAIAIGSVAIVRPYRMQSIVRAAYHYFRS